MPAKATAAMMMVIISSIRVKPLLRRASVPNMSCSQCIASLTLLVRVAWRHRLLAEELLLMADGLRTMMLIVVV